MKQIIISMVVIMLAAAVFALMVLYSVWMIRAAELRILTGELAAWILK